MGNFEGPAAPEDASKEDAPAGHAASRTNLPERLVPAGPRPRGAWVILVLLSGLVAVAFILHSLIAAQRH